MVKGRSKVRIYDRCLEWVRIKVAKIYKEGPYVLILQGRTAFEDVVVPEEEINKFLQALQVAVKRMKAANKKLNQRK